MATIGGKSDQKVPAKGVYAPSTMIGASLYLMPKNASNITRIIIAAK